MFRCPLEGMELPVNLSVYAAFLAIYNGATLNDTHRSGQVDTMFSSHSTKAIFQHTSPVPHSVLLPFLLLTPFLLCRCFLLHHTLRT